MKKFVYLVHVDRYTGCFNPFTWQIDYAPRQDFILFVQEIIKKYYPEYQVHCVRDEAIEKAVLKKIEDDKCVQICVQNKLNNGKE